MQCGVCPDAMYCSYLRTVLTVNRKLKNKIVCLCLAGIHGKNPIALVIKTEGLKFHPSCDIGSDFKKKGHE